MIRFGVLSYSGAGHLNPMISLSNELAGRDHTVTAFLPPQFEQTVRANGLGFVPIVVPEDPGYSPTGTEPDAGKGWSSKIRTRIGRIDAEIAGFLAQYPSAIANAGIDALIMDEIIFAGPTVAELLGLPYIVLSTSIPHNFGWSVGLSVPDDTPWQARLEKLIMEVSIFRMRGPIRLCLNRHRRRMGLSPVGAVEQTHPSLAHITQWPQCLDFSRPDLPESFYYTGPFAISQRIEYKEFPRNRLDGRPLVYASLGTTRKADPSMFYRIAEACAGLDVQLVVTLGGRRELADFTGLPGDPILVQEAPQLELLDRATVVITHAGPNTVLETLLRGKPMIALPLTLDQPAVANQIAQAGAAEVLPAERRSAEDIRAGLLKVLNTSAYSQAARALQQQLAALHGVSRAANIIESVLEPYRSRSTTGSPVTDGPPACLAP